MPWVGLIDNMKAYDKKLTGSFGKTFAKLLFAA